MTPRLRLLMGSVEGSAYGFLMLQHGSLDEDSVPELWFLFCCSLILHASRGSGSVHVGRCQPEGHLHFLCHGASRVNKALAGRWNMAGEPPFFRQRAERSGTSPLRHLLQLEGCLQRTARSRAPCGGCQNISRLPQATEYQEYLAGRE
jgi:hypothetical protein